MRKKERIQIVMDKLPFGMFIASLNLFSAVNSEIIAELIDRKELQTWWEENQDYRLTQVLLHFEYIPNIEGFWFYKEEVNWLIDEDIVEPRDILFWGVNFTSEMVQLPATKWVLISELETDHIQAIVKGKFTKNDYYNNLFKEELERRDIKFEELILCVQCGELVQEKLFKRTNRRLCIDCFKQVSSTTI